VEHGRKRLQGSQAVHADGAGYAAVASRAHMGDRNRLGKGAPHGDAAGKMAPVAAKSIPLRRAADPEIKLPRVQGRGLGQQRARRAGCGKVIGDGVRELTVRRRQVTRSSARAQARGENHRRLAQPPQRHRVLQRSAVRRHAKRGHPLRRHRGEPGQPAKAGRHLRQAAGRHRVRVEIHPHRSGRQALCADRCAVQHLRAVRSIRQDPPHGSQRQQRRDGRVGVRNTLGFDWDPKTRTSGSPTAGAIGCAKTCRMAS
jgi:hypothetical protein